MDRPAIDAQVELAIGALRVVTASPRELLWIDKLSRQFAWNLGYVPKVARHRRCLQRDYWRLTLDGDDAGFVLVGGGTRTPTRLSQVAVAEELWRRGIGGAVVDVLRAYAAAWLPKAAVVASVADSLPMNEVAAVTGGQQLCSRLRVSARGRRVHCWAWPSLLTGAMPCGDDFVRYLNTHTVRDRSDFNGRLRSE